MQDRAVPQRGLRRTLLLALFILTTALALLSGHALEQMHEVSPIAPQPSNASAASMQSGSDAALAAPGYVFDSQTQGELDGGLAGLCALVVTACIALVSAVIFFGRMRRIQLGASVRALARLSTTFGVALSGSIGSFASRSSALRI